MFALWMFGKTLENMWGAKRFLSYYIITALGAAALHLAVSQFQIFQLIDSKEVLELAKQGMYNTSNLNSLRLTQLVTTPTVGASGAVFGLLAAFGYLFPNTELMLLFPPIPIKAKYFVIGYAALELYLGISNNPSDNVAHFAHLGGALVGIIIVLYWGKNRNSFF